MPTPGESLQGWNELVHTAIYGSACREPWMNALTTPQGCPRVCTIPSKAALFVRSRTAPGQCGCRLVGEETPSLFAQELPCDVSSAHFQMGKRRPGGFSDFVSRG